jgi:hypothetical protein
MKFLCLLANVRDSYNNTTQIIGFRKQPLLLSDYHENIPKMFFYSIPYVSSSFFLILQSETELCYQNQVIYK